MDFYKGAVQTYFFQFCPLTLFFEYLLPNTFLLKTAEVSVNAVQLAEYGRQGSPTASAFHYPFYSAECLSQIQTGTTDFAFSLREQFLYLFPFCLCQFIHSSSPHIILPYLSTVSRLSGNKFNRRLQSELQGLYSFCGTFQA